MLKKIKCSRAPECGNRADDNSCIITVIIMVLLQICLWHIESLDIVRTFYSRIFRNIQGNSSIFSHVHIYWKILQHIEEYSDIIEAYGTIIRPIQTLHNPYVYNRGTVRTLAYLEPKVSSKSCQACKIVNHIQGPGIKTVNSNIFKDN